MRGKCRNSKWPPSTLLYYIYNPISLNPNLVWSWHLAGVLLRTQGNAVSSFNLFGWAVLQKAPIKWPFTFNFVVFLSPGFLAVATVTCLISPVISLCFAPALLVLASPVHLCPVTLSTVQDSSQTIVWGQIVQCCSWTGCVLCWANSLCTQDTLVIPSQIPLVCITFVQYGIKRKLSNLKGICWSTLG